MISVEVQYGVPMNDKWPGPISLFWTAVYDHVLYIIDILTIFVL